MREGATREHGAFLFDPDSWKGRNDELKLDLCKLAEDELQSYAMIATEIRQKLKAKAGFLEEVNKASGTNSDDEAE